MSMWIIGFRISQQVDLLLYVKLRFPLVNASPPVALIYP